MRDSLEKLLVAWVMLSARHARLVLLVILTLSVGAALYSYKNFEVNSDLSSLIVPSDELSWYNTNERFKKLFPQYQDTILLVVSGSDAAQVKTTGRQLYRRISEDPRFHELFAPQYMDTFAAHTLYRLDDSELKSFTRSVDQLLPFLNALSAEPSVKNYLRYLNQTLQKSLSEDRVSEQLRLDMESVNRNISMLEHTLYHEDVTLFGFTATQSEKNRYFELISLKSYQEFDEKLPNQKIVKNLRGLIDRVDRPEGVDINITGEVMLSDEEMTDALEGIEIAGMVSLAILALVLGFGIRSLSIVSAIFSMLICGISITSALGIFVVGSFNTLSLVFLVMFFGLGVDFAVHFSLKLAEEINLGDSLMEGMADATKDVSVILLLCAITSSIAFLSFLPTAYRGLAELGVISACGMLVAFVLSLTFFPAWFSLFGVQFRNRSQDGAALAGRRNASDGQVSANDDIDLHPYWGRGVLIVVVLLTLFCASLMGKLRFDFSILDMRNTGSEGMQTLTALQNGGLITDYSINVILDDETIDQIDTLKQTLTDLPEVREVIDITSLVPERQQSSYEIIQGVRPRVQNIVFQEVPLDETVVSSDKEIQQSLLLVEELLNGNRLSDRDRVLLQSYRSNLVLLHEQPELYLALEKRIALGLEADIQRLRAWFSAKPYTVDDLPEGLANRFIGPKNERLLIVIPEKTLSNRQDMKDFVESVEKVAPNISGRSAVEWGIGDVVVDAFAQAVISSVIVIFVLLLVYFRAVVLSVLVMVPLFLSVLGTFSIIVLTGLTLNMANILVVPLIFGLGIDTGIHVVHRYFACRSLKGFYASSTSKAVLISALTTIGSFLSLSFSPHKGAQSIGLLLAVALGLMVFITFVVLPVLLDMYLRRKHQAVL